MAPSWSAGSYLFRAPRERIAVKLKQPDSLFCEVSKLRNGPLYEKLMLQHPGRIRRSGEAELRGANRDFIVIIFHNELVLRSFRTELSWGNTVTFQILKANIEGTPVAIWERKVLDEFVMELKPWYANCSLHEEYWTKNVEDSDSGIDVMGLDIGRALPGLYWQNFFGSEFSNAIGKDRLMKAEELGDGVLLQLSDNPREWKSEEYSKREQSAICHLGEHWFFRGDRGYAGTKPLPLPGPSPSRERV